MAIIKPNNNTISAITALPAAIPVGAMTLLRTQTASDVSGVEFSTNLTSTYKLYYFKFINIHGANEQELVVDFSTDGGSTYDQLHQTTFFRAAHNEDGSDGNITYVTARDMANSGSRPFLSTPISTSNEYSCSGEMWLYDPSNTTFLKHFMSRTSAPLTDGSAAGSYSQDCFCNGYVHTTSAITALKFEMDSGNIQSGTFKLYGVS